MEKIVKKFNYESICGVKPTVIALYRSTYLNNGSPYIGAIVAEGEDAGEPWCDITVNLERKIPDGCIAINHNFSDFASEQTLGEIVGYLADPGVFGGKPLGHVMQGYATFPLYFLKEGVLDEIPTMEEIGKVLKNQKY